VSQKNIILLFILILLNINTYTQTEVLINTIQNITNINIKYESVILIQDSNIIISPNKKISRIPASFDWSEIPNLGISKNEIHTIKILRRQQYIYNSNIICFIPDLWSFKAKNWELQYEGVIPYLENLQFLDKKYISNLTTHTQIRYIQNSSGFFQDENSRLTGIYSTLVYPQHNVVNKILIISPKDKLNNHLMEKLFEEKTNIITNISTTNTIILNKTTNISSNTIKVTNETSVQKNMMADDNNINR